MAIKPTLERAMSNGDTKAWPQMVDYPQTELWWNRYANEWVTRGKLSA
jgi:hypothetical protein